MTVLFLIVGGASGTLCRHYLSTWVADATGSRPGGTFVVNVVGSFAIGLFLVLATERFSWPAPTVTLVSIGFLGGFTTFSAFSWQAVQQLEAGDYGSALLYVGGSVVCGILAAWAGASAARLAT
jgi:CrcB protein